MKRIYLSPPHMGEHERALLLDAFDSNWIAPLGPHVEAFEKEFAAQVNMPYAAALSSGTAALHLALIILGIKPGDEIIVPTLTFAATANAVCYMGASPVFVDSSASTWNIDPELLRAELSDCRKRGALPKAVIAVDLYGQCADYDSITRICAEFGVPLLEDAAEALGATYKGRPAGSFGVAAAFSFNGNKIITTSGGGMLVSNDKSIVDKARFLATQARDPAPHYLHSHIGYNYRLSNLLAAVGRGQLRCLNERIAQRRANYAFYKQKLAEIPGIEFMPVASYGASNSWLTCVLIHPEKFGKTREELRLYLETLNIESRPVWHPMHMQPVFKNCRVRGGSVAEKLFTLGLCLPSGSSLTPEDRDVIADAILGIAPRK